MAYITSDHLHDHFFHLRIAMSTTEVVNFLKEIEVQAQRLWSIFGSRSPQITVSHLRGFLLNYRSLETEFTLTLQACIMLKHHRCCYEVLLITLCHV
jgi:hypothetical protein